VRPDVAPTDPDVASLDEVGRPLTPEPVPDTWPGETIVGTGDPDPLIIGEDSDRTPGPAFLPAVGAAELPANR
jgi:hypothetical protein